MEKFLFELINVDNGVVHSSMMMTDNSARESNDWLRKQKRSHLEWRKKQPKVIEDFTRDTSMG